MKRILINRHRKSGHNYKNKTKPNTMENFHDVITWFEKIVEKKNALLDNTLYVIIFYPSIILHTENYLKYK